MPFVLVMLSLINFSKYSTYAKVTSSPITSPIETEKPDVTCPKELPWEKIDGSEPTYNAGSGKVISQICVKGGTDKVFFTVDGDDTCWMVTGIGTQYGYAKKIGKGSECKDISHASFLVIDSTPSPTPTITPNETPTVTPTGTPTDIPTGTPTESPTATPAETIEPSQSPTSTPSVSGDPSSSPTSEPSQEPTVSPESSSDPTPTPDVEESPTPTASATPTATPESDDDVEDGDDDSGGTGGTSDSGSTDSGTGGGEVLGASTLAGTGSINQNIDDYFIIFGLLLLTSASYSFIKIRK